MTTHKKPYGTNDNSYQAAGQLAGITALVDEFYTQMDVLAGSQKIREMHPKNLVESRRKLSYFLSGWLGGPKLYSQHFAGGSMPAVHRHLSINTEERDAWLACMQVAVDKQTYAGDFKLYLMEQLAVPAERIRMTSMKYHAVEDM